MKNRTYLGEVAHMSREEFHRRFSEISHQCKEVQVFEFEGCYFSGSIVGTIKAYIKENPAKSFFVWLIDNGLEVKNNQNSN
jgi:hypothetical protein